MVERTLIILKPECIERNIVGTVLSRLDGFKLVSARVQMLPQFHLRSHYRDVIARVGSKIGDEIVDRMSRGPCLIAVYEGDGVIAKVRELIGATTPSKAAPGTIRADFGTAVEYNVIHASADRNDAIREIEIWFGKIEYDYAGTKFDQTSTHLEQMYGGC